MTEDQIERRVEQAINRLDRQLMSGALTQEEYNAKIKELDMWANEAYKEV